MEKVNFSILLIILCLKSLCNADDYNYDDYMYNEYNYYTDDYSQESNDYYEHQNLLAPAPIPPPFIPPPPPSSTPPPPSPQPGKYIGICLLVTKGVLS